MAVISEKVQIVFDYADGDAADVWRCLTTLFHTRVGEQALNREFGLSWDFVDLPINVAKVRFMQEIIEKVKRFEPRAKVKEVSWAFDLDGLLSPKVVIGGV